jgi:hypothetical protein
MKNCVGVSRDSRGAWGRAQQQAAAAAAAAKRERAAVRRRRRLKANHRCPPPFISLHSYSLSIKVRGAHTCSHHTDGARRPPALALPRADVVGAASSIIARALPPSPPPPPPTHPTPHNTTSLSSNAAAPPATERRNPRAPRQCETHTRDPGGQVRRPAHLPHGRDPQEKHPGRVTTTGAAYTAAAALFFFGSGRGIALLYTSFLLTHSSFIFIIITIILTHRDR